MKNIRRWNYKALMEVTGLTEEEAKLMASAPDLFEALLFANKELKRINEYFKKTQENGVSALALGLIENAMNSAENG